MVVMKREYWYILGGGAVVVNISGMIANSGIMIADEGAKGQ